MNKRKDAKKRGKPFTISLEYFRAWCVKTGYMAGKGRFKDQYHVDCINEDLGYVPGNLQRLTNSENIRKSMKWRYSTTEQKMEFWMETIRMNNELDVSCPF